MPNKREDRTELFAKLEDPATTAGFFDRVAADVRWTARRAPRRAADARGPHPC